MPGCYIIDDEQHAIELLSGYVNQTPALELSGFSTDPVNGLHQVLNLKPDLLFLDIDMPKLSGLDMHALVAGSTTVIFTTAHASYAVEAFNLDAADFLLKPIRYSRFLKCIEKLSGKVAESPASGFIFLQSSAKGKMARMRLADIIYIESFNNYMHVHLPGEQHTVYMPLKELLEQLPADIFCRIHKSFIINYQKIKMVDGNRVYLQGSPELAVGPQYRDAFFKKVRAEQLRKK